MHISKAERSTAVGLPMLMWPVRIGVDISSTSTFEGTNCQGRFLGKRKIKCKDGNALDESPIREINYWPFFLHVDHWIQWTKWQKLGLFF